MREQGGAESRPLIILRGLRKEFNGVVAVKGLNLDIKEGEFMCFLGPSGCGKTTTLRMIAGLETPTAGDIFLRGTRVNDLPPQQRNVGFVFQNYALFWHMTAQENLAFGLKVRGISKEEIDKKVREMAESLELEPFLETKASRLSLSAMQRIALGRTLLTDPYVLLLDEPLNNIRPGLRELMRAELKRLQKGLGRTMIYVTHDQEEAMTLGDRILVMNLGVVEQLASPREVYHRPESLFVAGFIGRPPMNFLETRYRTEGDSAFLERRSLRWDVSSRRSAIEEKAEGEKIVLGIRPEHVLIAEEARRKGLSGEEVPAVVDLVQPLARKKIVDLKLEGDIIKMVVPSAWPISKGEKVKVVFDPEKIHLFDQKTERAII